MAPKRYFPEGPTRDDAFRALLEAAPDAMVIVNRAGEIVLVNAQTERLFGYARAELLGQPVERLMSERYRPAHVSHRAAYMDAAHVRPMGAGLDLHGRRKDGTEFPVEISLSPIETESGPLVASAIRDITERRAAEAERARLIREREDAARQARDELQRRVEERTAELSQANQQIRRQAAELEQRVADRTNELEAFCHSISHDLGVPLRAMDGFSRILLRDHLERLDEEGVRLLGLVRGGAEKMSEIIEGLLMVFHLGQRAMVSEAIDLAALARAVVQDLDLRGRPVRFAVGPLAAARGDPPMIRQVLVNLLSNALKFTRPRDPAVIEVGQTVRDGRLAYYVRDNGVGFDGRYADRIFGLFKRLHPEEEFEGTGVGLALVRRIVERHGGQVWAEGRPDEGATIYFALPGAADTRG